MLKLKNIALLLGIWWSLTGLLSCSTTEQTRSDTLPDAHRSTIGIKRILVVPLSFPGTYVIRDLYSIKQRYGVMLPDYIKEVSYGQVQVDIEFAPWLEMPKLISKYRVSSFRPMSWDIEDHKKRVAIVQDAVNLIDKTYDVSSYDGLMLVPGVAWKALGRLGYLARNRQKFFEIKTPSGKLTPPTDVHVQICPLPSLTYSLPKMLGGYENERAVVPTLYDIAVHSRPGPYGYGNKYIGGTRGHEYSAIYVGAWDNLSQHGIKTGMEFIPQGMTSFTKLRLGWIKSEQIITVGKAETRKIILGPLVSGNAETLVVRLPVSEDLYYLVENRKKKGVDQHLPAEGILILEVNERILEGKGPVRIINAHPDVPHFEDAPFRVGEVYENRKHGLLVKVLGKQGDDYSVEINRD